MVRADSNRGCPRSKAFSYSRGGGNRYTPAMKELPVSATVPMESALNEKTENSRQSSASGMFSGLRIVSLCTLLSRVLGLVRDVGMAVLFGNGVIMDAFTVAFRIPNLARRFFGEGALTAAFLPVFVGEMERDGRQAAWKIGSAVLVLLGLSLCGMVLLAELVLWGISTWGNVSPESALLIRLTALMMPYLILICLSAQMSAMLHAVGHFTWPALVPVVLNVVWIASIWWFAPWFDSPVQQVTMVSGCILIAGVFQVLAPWPTLKRLGFSYDPRWREAKDKVREIIGGMIPVLLGLSITQLNALADSLIAWGFSAPEAATAAELAEYPLSSGTASALYLGQRMYQFPLGVFGVALGTVLFPLLSRHAQRGHFEELRRDFLLGLQLVVCIGLPASVGLMFLADPLTALFFHHGAFDAHDAQQTATMIRTYGMGVWAYSALLIVHRGYYAVGDRTTPLRVGLFAVVCNLILSFSLIWTLGGRGLALATALAAMAQVLLVTWAFQGQVGRLEWRQLGRTLVRVTIATFVMALACHGTFAGLEEWEITSRFWNVAAPFTVSVAVYFTAARFLNLRELALLIPGGKR